jgi:hypothetical protein
MTTVVRPEAGEVPQSYAGYVAKIRDGEDVMAVLADQLEEVTARFGRIPESRGGHRYAPGKWSIKQILLHLSDAERVFGYRALRFARRDATPLAGFEEDAWAPESGADQRTLADLGAEWADVRRATLALLRGLPASAWERRGISNGKEISVRALAYATAGHLRHHLEVMAERYGA